MRQADESSQRHVGGCRDGRRPGDALGFGCGSPMQRNCCLLLGHTLDRTIRTSCGNLADRAFGSGRYGAGWQSASASSPTRTCPPSRARTTSVASMASGCTWLVKSEVVNTAFAATVGRVSSVRNVTIDQCYGRCCFETNCLPETRRWCCAPGS